MHMAGVSVKDVQNMGYLCGSAIPSYREGLLGMKSAWAETAIDKLGEVSILLRRLEIDRGILKGFLF